ncbi:DNA-3-methyladenine glycosylase I [Brumimicrobium aurantiacum]|uniref:DNA-3-methyladenine glycosylase I n=1 Tax=Brumimicrobium aurantiacum TaxID=1737063 RepID=A0A3E1EW58_9FLAO|nr:DNA-3-methyladenine glycosylase I [Brumimicrobium aurantiacum]RFC53777.1 DNA-3-methyladenine glycosylase I [Brumimicrobium aurantiacum]
MSYCEFTKDLDEKHLDKKYHDFRYGFRVDDDDELFGRLILEINQAGLNWAMILKKEEHFFKAFDGFKINVVAKYDEEKIEELMNNSGIIRNRRKIEAVIYNAKQIMNIQNKNGSFKLWLDKHIGYSLKEWTKLFRKNFKFTGEKIVEEFLMSTSYLQGAHDQECEIYNKVIKSKPKWEIK